MEAPASADLDAPAITRLKAALDAWIAAAPVSVFNTRATEPLRVGGGLPSTARDGACFSRTLLKGGRSGGLRLLGRQTIEFMTADHLGPIWRVAID